MGVEWVGRGGVWQNIFVYILGSAALLAHIKPSGHVVSISHRTMEYRYFSYSTFSGRSQQFLLFVLGCARVQWASGCKGNGTKFGACFYGRHRGKPWLIGGMANVHTKWVEHAMDY